MEVLMRNLSKHLNSLSNKRSLYFLRTTAIAMVCFPIFLFSQEKSTKDRKSSTKNSDEQLINQYIDAKGPGIISFDASNIKQFWIDNSVIGRTGKIDISLKRNNNVFESVPLKIQLANVYAFQDCKVEVISETPDFSFAVLSNNSKILSNSSKEQDFLNYSIASSVFHLDDTNNLSFSLRFSSPKNDVLSIKRIVLSFLYNSNYLSSPGVLKVSPGNISLELLAYPGTSNVKISPIDDSSFTAEGESFEISNKHRIVLSSNPVKYTLKIKNIGDVPTTIYIGYAPFTKEGMRINMKNNLYKGNKILKVVQSESNSNQVIVDSYPEWTKDCSLALNAKEDLSDFPNFSLADGKIVEVKKLDNGGAEVTLDKPLKNAIESGTQVRIQSTDGSTYLYMNKQTIPPGEEVFFSSTVAKDDSIFEYTTKAFGRGTYYVIPLIKCYSPGSKDIHTIQISDYEISY